MSAGSKTVPLSHYRQNISYQYIKYCILRKEDVLEVKENLYERIDILCSADIITKDDAAVCGQIVDILAQEREDVDEEKAGIFITHLAMALKRTKEGEKEEPIDAEILEALKEEPVYEKASAFFGKVMGRLPVELSDAEKGFIFVHVCNVLGG